MDEKRTPTPTEFLRDIRIHSDVRRVGADIINDQFVSTCETFDHGWETMIFPNWGVGGWTENYVAHYKTREEAIRGHLRAVWWAVKNK